MFLGSEWRWKKSIILRISCYAYQYIVGMNSLRKAIYIILSQVLGWLLSKVPKNFVA